MGWKFQNRIRKKLEKIYQKIIAQNLDPKVLQNDVERIKEFVEYNAREESLGLAAFISGYRDIFLTYPINYKFKNLIVLDNDVYKVPLVRLLAEQPPEVFLILFPDQSTLYRYTNGKLQEKESPILRDRRKRESVEAYIRRVKDSYWPYFRSDDVKAVFLLGRPELMEIFTSVLAKVAVQKVKEKIPLSTKTKQSELEKIIRELVKKYNIINPKQKVELARNLAQRRMAVFGPDAVFRALREGKVKELLLDPSFKPSGWRCQRCRLMGTTEEEQCNWCGGVIQPLANLKNTLLKDAELYDIQVTKVKHPYLEKEGQGIAALLRFS